MASRSICAAAVVVFALFCGRTDGAVTLSARSCNEDDFLTCLGNNADFLTEHTDVNDIPALMVKVCSAKEKPCTEIHPLDTCPEDTKARIVGLEKSLQGTLDALCEKDGALLRDVVKTMECWKYDAFVSCVETINVTAPGLDFLTPKRSQRDWDYFNAEIPKCVDGAREDTEECKAVDVGPVTKFIDIFFAPSQRVNNGSGVPSAASILTALLPLFVTLALSR